MTGPREGAVLSPLFTWRGAICDSELPATTRHVALVVSLHMNERGGSAFPGAPRLANETGLSERAVRDHLARLVADGWLILTEKGGIRGERRRANAYQAAIPAALEQPRTPAGGSGVEARPLQEVPPTPAGGSGQVVSEDDKTSEAAPPRKRKPFPEFDALVAVFGEPGTREEAAFYARTARSLAAQGKSPEDIADRGRRARDRWPTCSPGVVLSRWAALHPPAQRHRGGTWDDVARRDLEEGQR